MLLVFVLVLSNVTLFIGLYHFSLWPQLYILENGLAGDWFLLLLSNSHAIRLLLFYPVYYFSEVLNIDRNLLFSIIATQVIALVSYMTAKNFLILSGQCLGNKIVRFSFVSICAAVPLLLGLFMNGRGVFSMLGMLLVFNAVLGIRKCGCARIKHYCLFYIGFVFCSVSSGAAVLSVLLMVGLLLFYCFKSRFYTLFLLYHCRLYCQLT